MKKLLGIALSSILLVSQAFAEPASTADSAPKPDMRGLDKQIQDLKKDVLAVNRDLFILEEELLFPATSQVAIFLSVDVGEFFKLDSVQLKLNDKIVTNYLYTDREVDALHRGGVQRLHIGNLKQGKHELIATFVGKGPKGREYRRGSTLVFEKKLDAKYVELQVIDSASKYQPEFKVKEWE